MREYTHCDSIHSQEQPLTPQHTVTGRHILLWPLTLQTTSRLISPSSPCPAELCGFKPRKHWNAHMGACTRARTHTNTKHSFHDTLHWKNIRGSLALKPNPTSRSTSRHDVHTHHSFLLLPLMSTHTHTRTTMWNHAPCLENAVSTFFKSGGAHGWGNVVESVQKKVGF